jgi:hypothetical protein
MPRVDGTHRGAKSLLLLAFITLIGGPDLYAQSVQFSASEIEHKGSAAPLWHRKVYVRGMQMRVDTNFGNDGSYQLYDFSKNVEYDVFPTQHAYSTGDDTAAAFSVKLMRGLFYGDPEAACPQMEEVARMLRENPLNPDKNPKPSVCRKIGTGTINGRKAIEYEVATPTDKGSEDHTYYWVDMDLGFLVKSQETSTDITFEYQDIKVEAQPASLFEIPAEFRRIR